MSAVESQDFLVELGTEELPPLALPELQRAFAAGIEKGLAEAALTHAGLQSFAAPRRLAVLPSGEMLAALDDELEISGAKEIVVYGQYERILGAASRSVPDSLPSRPPAELVRRVTDGGTFVSFEPLGGDRLASRGIGDRLSRRISRQQRGVSQRRQQTQKPHESHRGTHLNVFP